MRIGFIGAGLMGHGMVLGLIGAGHQLVLKVHVNRQAIADLVAHGATQVETHQEMVQSSQVIFLCLSNAQAVKQVVGTLRPWLTQGQIIIDTSTSEPELTRRLAVELGHDGVTFVDAPLTGGPEQSARRELGVLCGADPEIYESIRPLLACFASTVRHMGPVGSGHTAKLISNYLVTGMIALVTEAFSAASRFAVDWRNLFDVMQNGSGNSGVLRKMVEPALAGNFEGYRFSNENALKDIGYFRNLGFDTDMAKAVDTFFSQAVADGQGNEFVSALLKPLRQA